MGAFIAKNDIPFKGKYRHCRLPRVASNRYKRDMKLRLKEMRKARGWTQVAVAEMAGMSQSYYTDLENGKKQINARRLEALAKVFGVRVDQLIESHGTPEHTEIAAIYSSLSKDGRRVLMDVAKSLLKGPDKR